MGQVNRQCAMERDTQKQYSYQLWHFSVRKGLANVIITKCLPQTDTAGRVLRRTSWEDS